jgi:sugar O-acyltransferase (sialic acid O-acetyltransferase NeuD family)
MPDATSVLIPLLNPNEPEALLVDLYIQEGQAVATGDVLCTLETTKSAADLLAEAAGYVTGLKLRPGQAARAGDLLCYLAPDPDWQAPTEPAPTLPASSQPANLRITQPALALARQYDLDLSRLPEGEFITESRIRELLQQAAQSVYNLPEGPFDPAAIVIYGGGGHGKALIDMLRMLGTHPIAGVLDDRLTPSDTILGVPVLGGVAVLGELRRRGLNLAVNAVGGIGNISIRMRVFQQLEEAGFSCPRLVHPRAFVETSAWLAEGVQVFPHAYVGSAADIGFGVIVNTGAIISHDCQVGDYANLSPGSILAGEVQIGEAALVGMSVTINLQVKVGRRARIGNSATVKSDVPEGGIVRAGTTWPPDQTT